MSDKPSAAGANRPQRKPQEVYYLRNAQVVVPAGYLAVGRIIGVHGLHGELKVELHTDFPERYAPGVTLRLGTELKRLKLTQVREHKGNLLLKSAEIPDRTAAEALRGEWLFVREDEAAELEEGAYWIHDIIGLSVETLEGVELGKITDVLATGANDVYVIQPATGVNRDRELLIPALEEVIAAVDLARGVMTVRLPDGLMDV
jgi:16S rRNA processing protein RimM